jgi:hypothetical protein
MEEFDPELWFHRRASFYVEAQLLYHLNTCGVLVCLQEQGPQTALMLAEVLGLEAKPLGSVLEYIAGVGPILTLNADGEFGLSIHGEEVIKRYSRPADSGLKVNLFDVRVGALGPIWEGVGRLLRGESHIGVDLHRKGDVAARGVFAVGAQMAPGLAKVLDGLNGDWEMEFGVTTGILSLLAEQAPGRRRFGLDRKASALEQAQSHAGEVRGLSWIQGELFDVAAWAKELNVQSPGVFFSVHFHEFMAEGAEKVQDLIRKLAREFPGSKLVAIEQPAESGESEILNLYAQSNRLIHHLVGNGKVLSMSGWVSIFEESGVKIHAVESLGYLGYKAFVVEL